MAQPRGYLSDVHVSVPPFPLPTCGIARVSHSTRLSIYGSVMDPCLLHSFHSLRRCFVAVTNHYFNTEGLMKFTPSGVDDEAEGEGEAEAGAGAEGPSCYVHLCTLPDWLDEGTQQDEAGPAPNVPALPPAPPGAEVAEEDPFIEQILRRVSMLSCGAEPPPCALGEREGQGGAPGSLLAQAGLEQQAGAAEGAGAPR